MDKKVTCEFLQSELFQIHLAIISRSAYATQKWASACSEEEQKQMQSEIDFLNKLTQKVVGMLAASSEPAPKEGEGKN